MRNILKTALLGGALLLPAASLQAAIVAGEVTGGDSGGSFVQLDPAPGTNIGNNNNNSPNLFALDEMQNVTLASAVAGIAAGTVVDSHYVFFDPVNSPASSVIGNVTFDGPILALITGTSALAGSDGIFGNANVNYLNPNNRGLEGPDTASFMGNQVFVNFVATSPGDYIRVLTASAVPEPGTWAMMLLGFFGLGAALRQKPAKARSRVNYA